MSRQRELTNFKLLSHLQLVRLETGLFQLLFTKTSSRFIKNKLIIKTFVDVCTMQQKLCIK